MAFFKWSKTAATNASADSTINWAEGQAPSSVNDSARAMMARTAEYRDDIAGALTTAGTSTAYTLATNQVFDNLADMNNAMIAFVPHTGNGATVTLNVDGTGAKPLRPAPSVELQSGALIQGTPYVAFYNNSDGAFYLHGASNYNSYSIPLGAGMPYFGSSAPNSSFAFSAGQAISRTTYATLFSLFGTTYGSGDGSTTFNIPDIRGRVIAGNDNMGGFGNQNRLSNWISSTTTGATGGIQESSLGTNNLPPFTPAGTISAPAFTEPFAYYYGGSIATGTQLVLLGSSLTSIGHVDVGSFSAGSVSAPTFTGTAAGGTSATFSNIQPTIIGNFIMRVI